MSAPPRMMRSTLRLTPHKSDQLRALAAQLGIAQPEQLAELFVQAGIVAFALNRVTSLPPGPFGAANRAAVVRLTIARGEHGIAQDLTDDQQHAIVTACRRALGFPT